MRGFKVVILLLFMILLAFTAHDASAGSACVDCHTKVTPGIVKQHLEGKMGQAGLDCIICHGEEHKGADDVAKAKLPTPETCAECHAEQVNQFKSGKHELAWIAASSMPMWNRQPGAVTGSGYRGCSGCHKIGVKSAEEQAKFHYGNAQCDACHTRHSFSKAEAKDPRACSNCHMGFDHPQWEMYMSSKHGILWDIDGNNNDGRAPTCQKCHMSGGNHSVMTSWGFLALRLPEEDAEWLNARVKILQYIGVLDMEGKPTARLDLVKAGKVARLTKEEFDSERSKMLNICSECHAANFARDTLDAGDQIIKASDLLFAEAIGLVQDLYKDGMLKKKEGWVLPLDGLQFYEAGSSIEQDLYLIFLEYRMRAFQGAFHTSNDYMHWYGWAPLKETVQRIRDEAARIRAEHKS